MFLRSLWEHDSTTENPHQPREPWNERNWRGFPVLCPLKPPQKIHMSYEKGPLQKEHRLPTSSNFSGDISIYRVNLPNFQVYSWASKLSIINHQIDWSWRVFGEPSPVGTWTTLTVGFLVDTCGLSVQWDLLWSRNKADSLRSPLPSILILLFG